MTDFGRIDFTYWPKTGEVEWHGHTEAEGDTPMLPVPRAVVDAGLAAFATEVKRWHDAARWFDERVGCHFRGRSRTRR